MTNQLDVRPEAAHLSNPAELFSFFDGYLDYTLDFMQQAKDAEAFSNSISEHALFLTTAFTQKIPMFFVDEKDFRDNLSTRLKKSLQKDDLVLENSAILLKAKTEDFVFYVATLMVQQFMELIKDCEEKQDSPAVFELRRNAFVQDWVNRFLGMEKYAE